MELVLLQWETRDGFGAGQEAEVHSVPLFSLRATLRAGVALCDRQRKPCFPLPLLTFLLVALLHLSTIIFTLGVFVRFARHTRLDGMLHCRGRFGK
jgi:hypothetical protein